MIERCQYRTLLEGPGPGPLSGVAESDSQGPPRRQG